MSQEFVFDTETEMNEFFEIHMADVIQNFKLQGPDTKYKLMKEIRNLAEEFLEYYEHYDEDVA